ncbi:c-type cytochrome [Photobacterium sanguinicancri]|uniref:C-type cytochrome n=1 Tax=Photobacterium sanguinicancri TaxID=875932 RepID=A0AAW7YBI4_9GAMM|nr:c-type cytochrome [Photobacterium sanguinicancri]KXI22806.1 cytochrome C [Photobacterium sanguinicancri]MDO6500272.1 c-type cytochrome [Photobacterium sanguinicancri]MDO6545096.1 c-type cytochrome [Photobacterium sanguinicancri]OZS45113.1 cytochrome c4 [Photobacterium sanguinicancri]
MKKLVLILSLLASCSAWAQGDAEAGKAKAATCAACHGADGNSIMAQYPKIAGQHPGYLEKQLKEFKLGITSGGQQGRNDPVMSAMAMPLSEQDMSDLAAYYASLPISESTTPESSIEIGQQLYRFGDAERGIAACTACHGPRGNGTSLSGFPKISGQNAEYVKLQLEKFRAGQRQNDMNTMMRAVAAKLSDGEITALSQYVGGLH